MTACGPIRLHIVYFAWVRERIGFPSEDMHLESPLLLSDLADRLALCSSGHGAAFADRSRLRAAVNQQFSGWETCLKNGDEVAFFPPVTGGN